MFGKQHLIMRGVPRRIKHHKRATAGYLLQEMVVTLFVLGIVAAVAIPKYTASLNRYRTQVACQRLVQDIELARRHARFTAQTVTLFVSFNKNFYRIDPLDSPLRPSSTYQVILDDTLLCPIINGLPSPISKSTQSDLTITFDRFGVPDASASVGICCGQSSGQVQLSAEGQVTLQ
ncbi:MAG: GspH/FimT family pseudopilin [Pirellula sp.]